MKSYDEVPDALTMWSYKWLKITPQLRCDAVAVATTWAILWPELRIHTII